MLTPRSSCATLLVQGMRDNRCRERVASALRAIAGVREVDVTLFRASARVLYAPPCTAEALVRAVGRAGYGALWSGGMGEGGPAKRS